MTTNDRQVACEHRRISGGHLVLPKITYFRRSLGFAENNDGYFRQNQVAAGNTSAFAGKSTSHSREISTVTKRKVKSTTT